ncbi:MAG: trypsin-like peptidase domain-containing protein [Planctomycetaceae bacterium]|nr:trypsin-like peptidase domain-containing protein [Planctomycetaceae bacterium]
MHNLVWILCGGCVLLGSPVQAGEFPAAGFRRQVVEATHRFEGTGSTATAFLVTDSSGDEPVDAEATEATKSPIYLITAAHVVEKMQGESAKLLLRKVVEGVTSRQPIEVRIRDGDRSLWKKHPEHDVAVLSFEGPREDVHPLPVTALADWEVWEKGGWEPGSLLWSVGYPHAGQFDPEPSSYPLVRLGCLATHPATTTPQRPLFLAEYNTFEGDSGGPVVAGSGDERHPGWILGLVHGQHFLNETYRLRYEEGTIRKRLGCAITIASPVILETMDMLDAARAVPEAERPPTN